MNENAPKLDEFLKSRTWQFTYDRKMSYLRMKLFNYGYCHQISKFFKVNINSEIYRIRNQNVSVYYEKKDHEAAFSKILDLVLKKKSMNLVKKIKKTIEYYYREFIKKIAGKPLDYSKYDNKKLILAYKDFCKMNEKISLPTWLLYLYFEEILTRTIRELLIEKLKDEKEAEKIISTLSKPSKILPLDAYNLELYEIALSSGKKRERMIKTFGKKYISWGVYDVNFEVPSISSHLDKIKNITVKDAEILIKKINENYKEQSKNSRLIKNKWKKEKYISALFDLYSLYADFKDWKNFYREQSSYKLRILLEEIASRISLNLEQVSFLTEKEVIAALNGELKLSSENINKRISDSAFIFTNNELNIITDKITLAEIDNCLTIKDVEVIKGNTAYPGFAKGPVKIIFSIEDLKKIVQGDILVASTTRPDYLHSMHKAAGFITNEGGMLSHAAILARELKKPCIIGTKNATKVLKDGDLVEVDADKGIVRIIKN